jgi:hypothetical protein
LFASRFVKQGQDMTRPPVAAAANRPLASLMSTGLEKLFHSWLGASGRRYICSVYVLGEPPVFDCRRALVAAVRRDACGVAMLFLFEPGPDEAADDLRFWTQKARVAGANEWHVHLLAETAEDRALVLRDLSPARRLAA